MAEDNEDEDDADADAGEEEDETAACFERTHLNNNSPSV